MYALFTDSKYVDTGRLNTSQLRLTQMDDRQFALATEEQIFNMELSATRQQNANQISNLYKELAELDPEEQATEYTNKKDEISAAQSAQQAREEGINQQVYGITQQENSVELEKKRLETMITKLSKEIEKIEEGEKDGIDRANPKYSGLG